MPIDYDPTREALYHPEQRATLFEAGRSYGTPQIAVEAARLAYVRAEVSQAQRERLQSDLSRVGLGSLKTFLDSSTGSQAFGACLPDKSLVLVAFRGTQPDEVTDLVHDVETHSVHWSEASGRVHAGFAGASRALAAQVAPWLAATRQAGSRVVFTGHSLGAALATLAASTQAGCELVTLGCPRVGDDAFLQALKQACKSHQRFVNCCDAVTQVPPTFLGYVHSEPSIYITAAGRAMEGASDEFIDSDRARARAAYLSEHAWRWGSVLLRDLADHAPINYLRAVFE